MSKLLPELRSAARSLARSPGFTSVAVLTLAVGIGANTAVFSLVDAVLLRSLPYRDAQELVHFWSTTPTGKHEASYPDFLDWSRETKTFASLAGYQTGLDGSLALDGELAPVRMGRVTASFFPTLGVAPALGRGFLPEDEPAESESVVVLSHGLYARRFGADAGVVGRTLVVNGTPRRVIGVLPAGFQFAPYGGADVWVAIRPSKGEKERRQLWWLRVLGRVKPGVTMTAASAEMTALAARLARDYPDSNTNLGIGLLPLRDEILGPVRPIVLSLLGAVALVLLIACANVAGLLLLRGSARRRELAIRVALGARRGDLMRSALAESLVLSLAGGALGLLLSRWGVALLASGIPAAQMAAMPYLHELPLHAGVLLFALLSSLGTALVFGTVPALAAARSAPVDALKGEVPLGAGRFRLGARDVFVVAQITLALGLLAGAGLMLKSTRALLRVDPGFETKNLLAAELFLPRRIKTPEETTAMQTRILESVRALPGVRAAATVDVLPLSGRGGTSMFAIEGRPAPLPGHEQEASGRTVSPTYFRDLGVKLAAGRAFADSDDERAPKVVIVNEALARRYFGSDSPVGRRIRFTYSEKEPYREIVGVVGNERLQSLDEPPDLAVYTPFRQDAGREMNVLVRTSGEPEAFTATMKSAIRSVDAEIFVHEISSMGRVIDGAPSTFRRRYPGAVIGVFSLAALFLSALGLYGLMANAVARRTREIGIRMAVGARPGDLVRLVLGGGAKLVALGVLAGVGAALLVGRALSSLLFGVAPLDGASIGLAAVSVTFGALLACALPALRARRVDPVVALRSE